MANYHATLTSLFDDIADAIRATSPVTEEIKADIFHAYILMRNYDGTIPATPSVLNSCSWDFIRWASDQGIADLLWSVGDRKSVAINGTVGTISISKTYYVFIIGINHNRDIEGTGITFGTFMTDLSGGYPICLVDGSFGENSTTTTKYFSMNHGAETTEGGWKGCDLRYDILGSTKSKNSDASSTTATSPVSGTLMSTLPSELRSVMKPMNIYSNNSGSNTDDAVSKCVDYLPLMSEFEVFGVRTYAIPGTEKNNQKQYDYYKNGNDKRKARHDTVAAYVKYHNRSVVPGNRFCNVGAKAKPDYNYSNYSCGVSPIFRV